MCHGVFKQCCTPLRAKAAPGPKQCARSAIPRSRNWRGGPIAAPPRMHANDRRRLRSLLAGGTRRSNAGLARALDLLRRDFGYLAEVAALATDEDPLISARALDVLERVAREHVEWMTPHKDVFLSPLADSQAWEIRLRIVRALPLFDWAPSDCPRVRAILRRDVRHPQALVRACALDALATLASKDPGLLTLVRRRLHEAELTGDAAVLARTRGIRRKLDRRRIRAPSPAHRAAPPAPEPAA